MICVLLPNEEQPELLMISIHSTESLAHFQELVHRAVNLWPDAHPEIKEFADKVTNGKVMQDYRTQEYYKLKG